MVIRQATVAKCNSEKSEAIGCLLTDSQKENCQQEETHIVTCQWMELIDNSGIAQIVQKLTYRATLFIVVSSMITSSESSERCLRHA